MNLKTLRKLHIISFIPLIHACIPFLYYFYVGKTLLPSKGFECIKGVYTAFLFALPAIILWIIALKLGVEQYEMLYAVLGTIYVYSSCLLVSQGLLYRMKKW